MVAFHRYVATERLIVCAFAQGVGEPFTSFLAGVRATGDEDKDLGSPSVEFSVNDPLDLYGAPNLCGKVAQECRFSHKCGRPNYSRVTKREDGAVDFVHGRAAPWGQ